MYGLGVLVGNRARPSTPEGQGGLMSRATRGLPDKRAGIVGVILFLARGKAGMSQFFILGFAGVSTEN
ncbi:MAG: hypothetical protein RL015_3586 [Verrucomicrobiota bacterium]|jgi:hypothetical protein